MREERGNAADGADFAFDIIERDVAFSRRIEFENSRNAEPFLKLFPDVGAQPVAAA